MKIINILTHVPPYEIFRNKKPEEIKARYATSEFVDIDKWPYTVGFFRLDWHHRWGSYIKQLSPEIEMECWRPYGNLIERVYEKDVDGILHKVFPSTSFKIKKVGHYDTSKLLLSELKKEIEKGKVIIHFYGSNSSIIFWLLNNLKPKKTPVILQHLGWSFSYFEYKYKNKPLKLIPYFFQKKALKYVNLYLTASKVEEEFMRSNFSKLKIDFFLNGIDFSELPIISKTEARKRLNIADSKKVILYVGRYYKTKSVDRVINAYNSIKNKIDCQLLLVGGYVEDEFYKLGYESGATIVLRTDNPIYDYFAAADIYIMPIQDRMHQDFAGFGIAPIEALAYGTPVISPNLKHFAGTELELKSIGYVMKDESDLVPLLTQALERNDKTADECTRLAHKYYDIHQNSIKLIEYYNELVNTL